MSSTNGYFIASSIWARLVMHIVIAEIWRILATTLLYEATKMLIFGHVLGWYTAILYAMKLKRDKCNALGVDFAIFHTS